MHDWFFQFLVSARCAGFPDTQCFFGIIEKLTVPQEVQITAAVPRDGRPGVGIQ